MPHAKSRIWVHVVWGTKYREFIISPEIESILFLKIRDEFKRMRCPVRIINGTPDHVHCLFGMNPNLSIAQIIKQVKGSSSRYLNELNLVPGGFKWQEGYGAFSVSESAVEKVFRYIRNQKVHHGISATPSLNPGINSWVEGGGELVTTPSARSQHHTTYQT